MLEQLGQDLRYGRRMLRKSEGFTATDVLSLGLGIGANTAIFSAVNTLLLQTLPVGAADRVVFGLGLREGCDPCGLSRLEYEALQELFRPTPLGTSDSRKRTQRRPSSAGISKKKAEWLTPLRVNGALYLNLRSFLRQNAY